MKIFPGNAFTWNRPIGLGTAEASDLGLTSLPATLHVRSHRTGVIRAFRLVGVRRRGEDDSTAVYSDGQLALNIVND